MVIMQQSPHRFLEKVPFITAPGTKVRTLISTMGRLEKLGCDEEFTLTKYFANRDFHRRERL